MGIQWAAILLIGLTGEPDASRDDTSREADHKASQRGPAWVPRFFQRGEWWKKKPAETPIKPRTDEAAARRPALSSPARGRTDKVSDNLIISRCRASLYQESALKDATIYVALDGDVVVLTGTVTSIVLKDRAEKIARKTEGVADVRNNLVISNDITNWLQPGGVALNAPPKPQATQSMRPSNESVTASPRSGEPAAPRPAFASAPITAANSKSTKLGAMQSRNMDKVIPAPPTSTAAATSPNLGKSPAVITQSGWETVDRRQVPWIPTVTLGPPQRLAGRSGQPTVFTYVKPLPTRTDAIASSKTDANDTSRNEVIASSEATRIPATILEAPRITMAGAAARTTPTWQPTSKAPALLPPIDSLRLTPPIAIPARPSNPNQQNSTANKFPPVGQVPGVSELRRLAAPATTLPPGRRADIDQILNSDQRARQLNYQIKSGELELDGAIATPSDLYEIAARLSNLPGIDAVGFSQIHFGY